MRCYGSFLVRCWQSIDVNGSGPLRVEIEHVQTGRRTRTINLVDAVDWLDAEWQSLCDKRVAEAGAMPTDDDPPPGGEPWYWRG